MTPFNREDTRNVIPLLKGLTDEQVEQYCRSNSQPAAVAMMQIQGDFNFGSVVRNANAFGMEKIFYVGPRRKWDKRGAVGTYHYKDVIHCSTIGELYSLTEEAYTWVALECNVDYPSVNINNFVWPKNPLILIGEEGKGLEDSVLSVCDHIVYIPQCGSVPSLNAACASGIAMHSYTSQP